MVGISNLNGVEERLGFYYNDNGVIKTIDDYDVLIERDGSVIKFPQKQKCVINLDCRTWLLNGGFDKEPSSFITNSFTFSSQSSTQTTFGTLTDTLPTSGDSFQVSKGNYWYIPISHQNDIFFGENILTNQQFTIALTLKQFGTPSSWRNLTWFNNNDGIRFEWNAAGHFSIYSENNLISGNADFPRLSSYRDDWVQLIMVVDGNARTLKGYQNGVLNTTNTLSRALDTSNGNYVRLFSQRGASNTGSYGCPVALRDFQIWKTALTEQEIADLRKWLFLD